MCIRDSTSGGGITSGAATDASDTEYDDEPIRPCASCGDELDDDPPPRTCRACNKEICFQCLERCYAPGCGQRFCVDCIGWRGEFTLRLCWPSGECIRCYENVGDLCIERLKQDMDEGLIRGLPGAAPTIDGHLLQSYCLVSGTEIMRDGSTLNDYDLPHGATLTAVVTEHTA